VNQFERDAEKDRRQAAALLSRLREGGWDPRAVDYGDGEVIGIKGLSDEKILTEIFAVDDCFLVAKRGEERAESVFLTMGQGGDLICDHSLGHADFIALMEQLHNDAEAGMFDPEV
jgi:hypothetical protein